MRISIKAMRLPVKEKEAGSIPVSAASLMPLSVKAARLTLNQLEPVRFWQWLPGKALGPSGDGARLSSELWWVQFPSAPPKPYRQVPVIDLLQKDEDIKSGIGIVAVRQPSKLNTGVRFSYSAPINCGDIGLINLVHRIIPVLAQWWLNANRYAARLWVACNSVRGRVVTPNNTRMTELEIVLAR